MDKKILFELLKKTDTLLWSSYDISINKNYANRTNNLIYPVYHNKSNNGLRVSEQEARFIFSYILQNTKFLYSIETPTVNDYQQKGEGKRSAGSDMTIYSPVGQKLLNIEFKFGTISNKAKSSFPIAKDIEKIFSESIPGCWFHILKSINNSSITALLQT